jgi:selenophosphate synthetase-related protein
MSEDFTLSQVSLEEIVSSVRAYPGLTRKQPIEEVFEILFKGQTLSLGPNYGDDAAVIPWGEGYLLLSADGIMTSLLKEEPYAAGKASVMVTVNDIYSMGGRPIGLVNVLASGEKEQRRAILEGIKKGCEKLKVPMLGGHLHPDAPYDQPSLSVAILGYAKRPIRGWTAEPGDELIVAVDLNGRPGCRTVTSWDANSGKTSKELLWRLEAMVLIGEKGLATAAKDISNAGLLGTISIMMENSNTGALIYLERIPLPRGMRLSQWIRCFQSYGFVLSAKPKHVESILEIFGERGISCARIGQVVSEQKVQVIYSTKSITLFNFKEDSITGIRRPPIPPSQPNNITHTHQVHETNEITETHEPIFYPSPK